MRKTKILIYIFIFQLSITNCNTYNNDKTSSTTNREKMQNDMKENISENKDLIEKIRNVDSIDQEKKIKLDDKNTIPFFLIMERRIQRIKFVFQHDLEILTYNFLKRPHIIVQTLSI